MVKFKEAYSLASKVVSVMQEIYDCAILEESGGAQTLAVTMVRKFGDEKAARCV